MKKVWITTDMDLLEDREFNENNEEVKKKTVILEAEGDNKVYATFEQNITRNKIIFWILCFMTKMFGILCLHMQSHLIQSQVYVGFVF